MRNLLARRPRPAVATQVTEEVEPLIASPAFSDRFFRQIVSSMRSAVIAIHRDGSLALINDEACRIFALTRRPDDVGRPYTEVFSGRNDLVRLLAGAFGAMVLPSRVELRLTDVDRVIGHTLSQVKDEQGAVVGAVLFFKDLTRVEQLEEQDRLRDRLAALGEMAAGIAHELKNPLAAISVMAGLLRRQVPDSVDAQSLLADILSEAKLANTIVVDMLEFVRPLRLQLRKTNLTEVLQQAVTLAESKDIRGACAVDTTLQPELPIIDGDQHQLTQVFTNLLTNAFEALEGRGQVDLTAVLVLLEPDSTFTDDPATPTQAIVIDVIDHGPGVPPHLIDRIFDPFFTTKPQGSGLGLSIVRKIIDAHDGRIDLTVIPNGGTRFRVTLPVSDPTGGFKQKGT
jgi:nitrogen-specific signal transduction histidine kinase